MLPEVQGEFAVNGGAGRDTKLSLKKVAAVLGDKGVRLAAERDVIRVTGYQIGSVSVTGFGRDDIAGYEGSPARAPDLPQAIIERGAAGRGGWPWRPPAWVPLRWPTGGRLM